MLANPEESYILPASFEIINSNSSIARAWLYDNYLYIEGLKNGKCTLTVLFDKIEQFKINVTVKGAIPALNYTGCSLMKGDTMTLLLNNAGEDVEWYSSDKKVAT